MLVLEAEDRVGGRMKSEARGSYWLSVGAHMFPGPGSVIDGLVNDMEPETLPIRGSLLGIAYRGRIVRGNRAETYPFRLPVSLAGRLSFIRAGLKMRGAARKYNAVSRQKRGETASDVRARGLAFSAIVLSPSSSGHSTPRRRRSSGRRRTGWRPSPTRFPRVAWPRSSRTSGAPGTSCSRAV